MKVRLAERWDALRSSYWFLPALISAAAAGLALGMVALDGAVGPEVLERVGWIYTGGAEGARGVLSVIAGSMITVAGVAFSVLVVALSLAASQFGPRVLRSFMRDAGNQFVLGAFVGTFLYCLLVLRTVRGGDESGGFVPHLSVTLGVGLAVLGVGVLIYFVHHAAVSIQVSAVISALAEELDAGVERVFPAEGGSAGAADEGERDAPGAPAGGVAVAAAGDGYVQAVDVPRLVALAKEHGAVVHVEHRAGDFVARGDPLAMVGAADTGPPLESSVRRAFALGSRRTPWQDVEFAVQQLADVAVRALSPGTNDPFTAAACVDRLGAALARVAERPPPARVHRDADGAARVVMDPPTFELLMESGFGPVRHYAAGSAVVLLRLLAALGRVARHCCGPGRRDVVLGHADRVLAAAERELADGVDRSAARELHRAVHAAPDEVRVGAR